MNRATAFAAALLVINACVTPGVTRGSEPVSSTLSSHAALTRNPILKNERPALWAVLLEAVESCEISGELSRAGEAGERRYWIETVTRVFENSNKAGVIALVREEFGSWIIVSKREWVN